MARRRRNKNRERQHSQPVNLVSQTELEVAPKVDSSGTVASELRRSMVTSLMIVLILAAAASLNNYYHWTTSVGNLLYDLLNIR